VALPEYIASGVVVASAVATLVVELVRSGPYEGSAWRRAVQMKSRDVDWPLFLAAVALVGVAGSSDASGWLLLLLALPIWILEAWYIRSFPKPAKWSRKPRNRRGQLDKLHVPRVRR
jgi:hypothetical protein